VKLQIVVPSWITQMMNSKIAPHLLKYLEKNYLLQKLKQSLIFWQKQGLFS